MNGETPMSAQPLRILPDDTLAAPEQASPQLRAVDPAESPACSPLPSPETSDPAAVSHGAADAIEWREGVLDLPAPFRLESGAVLDPARLAWQCVGPADAPLVVVLGGISAHRSVCRADGKGWWQEQCGAGRALDTSRYRVLGIDWLGGCDASTGPRPNEIPPSRAARQSLPLPCAAGEGKGRGARLYDTSRAARRSFPAISTADQARALLALLNRLGVRRLHLLVGASYGGNVAQQLAALLGERLRRLVLLSAAHRPAQFGLALRHIQREILELGDNGSQALELARALAVLCYRTPHGVDERFADGDDRGGVVGWLQHHGARFGQRFDTQAYRCLMHSLDTHGVDPAAIRAPTTLFAVREDLTVPLALLHEYARRAGAHCELVEISSPHGHDAFLKEETAVATLLRAALEATP